MKKGIFFSIPCFLFATGGDKTYAQTEDQWVPNDVLFKISTPFNTISVNDDRVLTEKGWFNQLSNSYKILEFITLPSLSHPTPMTHIIITKLLTV